jgi:hypothetical protein
VDERYAPPGGEGPSRTGKDAAVTHRFEYFTQPQGAKLPATGCLVVVVPCAVAALFGLLDLASLAFPAAAVTAVGLWWGSRNYRARPQATLTIQGEPPRPRLEVLDKDFRELLNVPLNDLLEVELDTKTIQRVQMNRSIGVLPQLGMLNNKVGSASDISRIVLLTTRQEVPLTEQRISVSYATESFGDIRRFLRKHGWLPEAER